MPGIEQFPGAEQYPRYGYDASSGKVFKKGKEEPRVEPIKYPRYRYDQQTGSLTEIIDDEDESAPERDGIEAAEEKQAKHTKLRLIGVFLAMIAAGTAGKIGYDTAQAKKTERIEQPGDTKMSQMPVITADNQVGLATVAPKVERPAEISSPQEAARQAVESKVSEGRSSKQKVEPIKKIKNAMEKMFHHKARSFDQMFDYHHKGRFNNADRMADELEQYWLEWYKNHPNRLQGLLRGYYEYTAWQPHIEKRLKEKNIGNQELQALVPYIALTETDFINKKPSSTNAVGPFQIMKATGENDPCNLTINKLVDPRRDPVEGGEACARILEDNRIKLGEAGRPMEITPYSYNGSFVWSAQKEAKTGNRQLDRKGFMRFLENDMNIIKEVAEGGRWEFYRTKKNEKLDDIFTRFLKAGHITSEAEFYCLNRSISRDKKLHAGIKIVLPLKVGKNRPESAREKFYNKLIAGRRENADYGSRLVVVKKIIRESGALNKKKVPINFDEITVANNERGVAVKKIIKQYGVSHKSFKEVNEKIVGNIIPPETTIRVPRV